VKDSAGANNGTLVNGATFADGKVGRAFSFDGIDDHVVGPSSAIIGGAQATYMAWVKPGASPTAGSYYALFGVGDSTRDTTAQCRMLYYNNGGLRFYMDCGVNSPATDYATRITSGTYPAGNWYHVVGVFNNGSIDIYVNGIKDTGAGPDLDWRSNRVSGYDLGFALPGSRG